MATETEILYATIGRRIAELRKQKGLSQVELAAGLTRKRTQAWVSTVESGRRNVNAFDLSEIATVLQTTIGDLFSGLSRPPGPTPKSLSEFWNDLGKHLPMELPVFLQRDLAGPDPTPVDYQYASTSPGKSIFNEPHPMGRNSLTAMVVERYYSSPRLDPTDLVTFSGALIPHPDPDGRVTDRVLVKLVEPYDGLNVHPCLIKQSGDAETTLAGHESVVFPEGTFEVMGVIILRRTLYRASFIRAWIQRQFGIVKDERIVHHPVDDDLLAGP